MELNGIANLKIHLDNLLKELPNLEECQIPLALAFKELDLLERYMVEQGRAQQENRKSAYWHEVKLNPSKFPLNKRMI